MSFLSGIGKSLGTLHHSIRTTVEAPIQGLPGGKELSRLGDKGDKLAEKAAPVAGAVVGAWFGGAAGAQLGYSVGEGLQSGLREAREEREARATYDGWSGSSWSDNDEA